MTSPIKSILPTNAPVGAGPGAKDLARIYSILAHRTEDMIRRGLDAVKPAAKGTNRFYWATDTLKLYFDDGVWRALLGAGAIGSSFAWGETPAGAIDGSNRVFTTAHTPFGGNILLMRNREMMVAGSGNDYQISTNTITYETGNAPNTGDFHVVFYPY
jgi:hypothetical protein